MRAVTVGRIEHDFYGVSGCPVPTHGSENSSKNLSKLTD